MFNTFSLLFYPVFNGFQWNMIFYIFLTIITSILPPTFYPYGYVPKDFLYIIALSPTTPAAVVVQGAFGLSPMMDSMFYILIIETICYTILARILVRWREN